MTTYLIKEDQWSDTPGMKLGHAQSHQKSPLAIETESCFLFRDDTGKTIHKYSLSPQKDIYGIRHYLDYISLDSSDTLDPDSFKWNLLYCLSLCIDKISAHRKTVSFLEIGSTIGENYTLIQKLVDEHNLDIDIEFVGYEISNNFTQFSYLTNRSNKKFHAVTGDASDLSRFPDNCFDFVINNGVANFVHNQKKCFSELIRVARVAAIMGVQITHKEHSFYVTGTDNLLTFFPTKKTLHHIWEQFSPLFDYHLHTADCSKMTFSGQKNCHYIGVDSKDLQATLEYHIIAKENIFPELQSLCQILQ